MGFKLKNFSDLVGIDKESSTYGTPVFKKDLEGTVVAEANNDGTIFVDEKVDSPTKKEAVAHEKVHIDQLKTGRLQYDDNTLTWKKDTRSPARVYKRENGKLIDTKTGESKNEGDPTLEWEHEAYFPKDKK
jgi:hypothetical protein